MWRKLLRMAAFWLLCTGTVAALALCTAAAGRGDELGVMLWAWGTVVFAACAERLARMNEED